MELSCFPPSSPSGCEGKHSSSNFLSFPFAHTRNGKVKALFLHQNNPRRNTAGGNQNPGKVQYCEGRVCLTVITNDRDLLIEPCKRGSLQLQCHVGLLMPCSAGRCGAVRFLFCALPSEQVGRLDLDGVNEVCSVGLLD